MVDPVLEKGIRNEQVAPMVTKAFLDYSMSVITSRALPDVRDGLKPVHRRILFAMEVGKYKGSFSKCARIVGDAMGKFHPHGDSAIYEALVRMAQTWKQRVIMIEGQGNFGNIDGEGAAAMRYTEARLASVGQSMTQDAGDRTGTVDFRANYDGKELEPTVLPARFPNILVNGSMGIAVSVASTIPTHNLGEAIDAAILLLDDPEATVDDVLKVMPGPDLPTRGVVMGLAKIREAYVTGRGSIPCTGVATIEDGKKGRQQIVITEIPYNVERSKLIERLVELVNDKKIEGVTNVKDESEGDDGVRIVVQLKQDAPADIVLNGIRKMTDFQTNLQFNATVLSSRGEPKVMGVVEILTEFVKFRRDVVRRRTLMELDKARDEQIKQIALYSAVGIVDEVVRIIRNASDRDDAQVKLMAIDFDVDEELASLIKEADPDAEITATFRFIDVQADAVLRLNLSSLTGLARDEIASELRSLGARIRGLIEIVEDQVILDNVVRREMQEVKARFATPRLTPIMAYEAGDIDEESLVERKDVVVTLTKAGYAKRTELSAYRAQKRGGKGKTGMATREEDFVIEARVCTTRTPLLVFTSLGQAFGLKTWKLPEADANARGKPIVNYIDLREGEKVTALVPLPEDRAEMDAKNLVFVTDFGSVRRNRISDFLDMNRKGKMAIQLDDEHGSANGRLVAVLLADDADDLLLATTEGICARFPIDDLRVFQSRTSTGVRGIRFKRDGDKVVDACVLKGSRTGTLERDLYLAGGSRYVRDNVLVGESGERRPIPEGVALVPEPEDDKPDRMRATLSAERMEELRAEERFLLTVTASGYGKRSSTHEYRVTKRDISGFEAAAVNDVTGPLVACLLADDGDQVVLMTDGGQAIRARVNEVGVQGRSTRGVRLLSIPDGQRVASVALVASAEKDAVDDPSANEGGDDVVAVAAGLPYPDDPDPKDVVETDDPGPADDGASESDI